MVVAVAKLIYSAITSLDGYVADERGGIEWAAPDEEVHAFVNELERPIGAYLYGRRMYETMVYWETRGDGPGDGQASREFAGIWRAAEKVVYSRRLPDVSSARTRLERELDPDSVRRLKAESGHDLSIGDAELAGQALLQGLVDECHLFVTPVVVGGGTGALPNGLHAGLELLGERRFAGGVVHLHYRLGS